MSGELKSRAHSFGQNCYHLVWRPHLNIPMLKPLDIRKVCAGVFRMIANQHGFTIHEMKILPNHVHLFIEFPPRYSLAKVYNILKGTSSRILRRNFPWLRKFKRLWSKGKFHRTVGNVTRDVVENYIAHSKHNWDAFNTIRHSYLDKQLNLRSF